MDGQKTIDDVLKVLNEAQGIANEIKQSGIPALQPAANATNTVVNDVDFLIGIGETFTSIAHSIRSGNLLEAVTTIERTALSIGELVKGLKV